MRSNLPNSSFCVSMKVSMAVQSHPKRLPWNKEQRLVKFTTLILFSLMLLPSLIIKWPGCQTGGVGRLGQGWDSVCY